MTADGNEKLKVFYPEMLMNRTECCDDNHWNFAKL